MTQLGKLSDLLKENLKGSTQILTISPDTPEQSEKMRLLVAEQFDRPLDFPLLSDPEHKVIDRYGLLNPAGKGWPHPAVFVIDRSGKVTWKFLETDHRVRASNEAILEVLRQLQ